MLAATSASSVLHTLGPANPSTVRPFWFSNASTADLVITVSTPSVHCDVSSSGIAQRHENVPGTGWAASWGAGGVVLVA